MRTALQLVSLTVVLGLGVSQSVTAQGRASRAIRFADMDRDGDGVITRAEWRGNDRSFRVHDWNGDGVLSGEEVRVGAQRPNEQDREIPSQAERFDDWTPRGFNGLDLNGDNRITRDEWRFDAETFRRADHNNDGSISRSEFLGNDVPSSDRFTTIDVNGDGRITRDEWPGSRAGFDNRDDNRDGQLTRDEFQRNEGGLTATYRAGYDRGLAEGRAAGREDRDRNQGWDLEGQRELETADSGYESRLGPRAEYQNGYREGFRRGYREGYGPRDREVGELRK